MEARSKRAGRGSREGGGNQMGRGHVPAPPLFQSSDLYRKTAKAQSELSELVAKYREWKRAARELEEARARVAGTRWGEDTSPRPRSSNLPTATGRPRRHRANSLSWWRSIGNGSAQQESWKRLAR